MNIFKQFVLARPVKTPLKFGHNENIVIESIDFGVRKRKGIAIKANTFIKLSEINPEDKSVLANTEINFFNLDPTKDFVFDNFISQFSILGGIIDSLGGDVEVFDDKVQKAIEGDTDSETLAFLKKGANAKAAQDALVESFKEQVEDKIGLDSTLLKCKMVSNKSGYLQPANEMMWILPMDSEEELPVLTSREIRIYKKSLTDDGKKKKATPDAIGKAKAPGTQVPEAQVSPKGALASI